MTEPKDFIGLSVREFSRLKKLSDDAVGQIVYVSKHFAGSNWQSLSIPLGQSKAFNEAPDRYIEKDP